MKDDAQLTWAKFVVNKAFAEGYLETTKALSDEELVLLAEELTGRADADIERRSIG